MGLREGLDHRLYCPSGYGGILQLDATTGALTRVTVDVSSDADGVIAPRVPIVAALTTRSAQELELREGSEVWASFKAMAVHLC